MATDRAATYARNRAAAIDRERALTLVPPKTELSTAQAATRLGISPEAVRARLEAGALPGYRVGRTWRIRAATIDDLLSGDQNTSDIAAHLHAINGRLERISATLGWLAQLELRRIEATRRLIDEGAGRRT